ncbi:MAG: endo-1,4-beta-xylanase [Chitinophagaceae bacterium]
MHVSSTITIITILIFFNTVCKEPGDDLPKQDESLKGVAPFPVGASISPTLLQNNAAYKNVLTTEMNSITPENAMKFGGLHPQPGTYTFSAADVIVDFAQSQNKRLHGHTLVWHQSLPNWLVQFGGDSAAWEGVLKQHIQMVVGRYKGKLASWDVVNEAFQDNGTLRLPDTDTSSRDNGSIWARKLGRDYIARAFRYAREADPALVLFYNDYGQEYSTAKTLAIKNMVTDFKTRGVPIDGIGLQMHININTSRSGIINAFTQLAGTGLKIHISELDISVNPKSDPAIIYSDSIQKAQGDLFAFVVQQYKMLVPKPQQYGITTWNVGDADSWIRSNYKRKDWPLLFDDNYQKKPVYYDFLKALKN